MKELINNSLLHITVLLFTFSWKLSVIQLEVIFVNALTVRKKIQLRS